MHEKSEHNVEKFTCHLPLQSSSFSAQFVSFLVSSVKFMIWTFVCVSWWRSGRALDLQPPHFGYSLGQDVHTHVPLSPSSINLVLAQAGKVTVGLTLHWPCVTDNSSISTYGLTALEREMSTPPTLQPE